MPQPGDKVRWNGNHIFGNDALLANPELASWVSAIIAGWSGTEAHLGRIFATLIGSQHPIALSMYTEVKSFDVQKALLERTAREILPEDDALLLSALLIVIRPISGLRNQFAHWIWGASADPKLNALLLAEPKHFMNLTVEHIKFRENQINEGPHDFVGKFPSLDRKYMWVYRLNDFREAKEKIDRAYRMTEAFRRLIDAEDPIRQELKKVLIGQPDLGRALAKVRANAPRK